MLVFTSKLSITITQPEFPEFITKFDPTIKLPNLNDLSGFYKPASQELTIIRNQEENDYRQRKNRSNRSIHK